MACMAAAALPASAADSFLKLVPDAASGFVVINRPAATDAKVQKLGAAARVPAPARWR